VRHATVPLVALLACGCGGSPSAAPAPLAVVPSDPATEARLAMAAGDWQTAMGHLRQALVRTPHSVDVHYRLAVCASHLDLHREAVREFEWVLAHARSDSPEARTARSWLAETARTSPARVASAVGTAPASGPSTGALSGTVTWREPGATPQPRARQLLMLIGQDGTPTKDTRYRVRTNRDGRFEFKDVVPGPYQVTDALDGRPTWRLRVVVEAGRETVLDLSPTNSAATPASRSPHPTEGN
jgi:hypothetical protein